jgi:purine nucleoside permease
VCLHQIENVAVDCPELNPLRNSIWSRACLFLFKGTVSPDIEFSLKAYQIKALFLRTVYGLTKFYFVVTGILNKFVLKLLV